MRSSKAWQARGTAPAAIAIVGDDERKQLLACSQVDAVRLDERQPSIVQLFEAHVARSPDAVAVVEGERSLTYRQLDRAANGVAARLSALGVEATPVVAVYLPRGADAVIAFLGILKARGTYVPIDTSYPAGRVASILQSAAPLVVVTRADLMLKLPAQASAAEPYPLLCVDRVDEALEALEGPRPEDAAYVIFTSGSTGQPKAWSSIIERSPTMRARRSTPTRSPRAIASSRQRRWASI